MEAAGVIAYGVGLCVTLVILWGWVMYKSVKENIWRAIGTIEPSRWPEVAVKHKDDVISRLYHGDTLEVTGRITVVGDSGTFIADRRMIDLRYGKKVDMEVWNDLMVDLREMEQVNEEELSG